MQICVVTTLTAVINVTSAINRSPLAANKRL